MTIYNEYDIVAEGCVNDAISRASRAFNSLKIKKVKLKVIRLKDLKDGQLYIHLLLILVSAVQNLVIFFINKESKMINFIVGFICGIIIATIVTSLGVYDMIIGDIDISDETLKNHSVQMVINRIPDDLDKRHYLVFRVFHKEDRNENA